MGGYASKCEKKSKSLHPILHVCGTQREPLLPFRCDFLSGTNVHLPKRCSSVFFDKVLWLTFSQSESVTTSDFPFPMPKINIPHSFLYCPASRCPSSLLQCVLFSCAQSSANSFVLGIPISFPPLQCLNFIFSILPVSLFHPPPLPALFSLGVQPCILVLINVPFTIRRCVKSCFKRDLVKSHLQELLYHKQASLLLVYD